MADQIQQDAAEIVAILNELFENEHDDSLSPSDLMQRVGIEDPRFMRALTLLEGVGWVEKWAEHISGYDVRLSLYGKEAYDRQAGNAKNVRKSTCARGLKNSAIFCASRLGRWQLVTSLKQFTLRRSFACWFTRLEVASPY